MSKTRNWCFTLNNYSSQDESMFQNVECKYIVYGREVGEECGTPHLQGYIVFDNPRALGGLKKDVHSTAHWEAAVAGADKNRTYCIKQGDFYERGVLPMSQKRKGEANADRWRDAKKAAVEGRLDDIPEDIYIQYYRTIKEIKKDHMVKPDDLDGLDNVWLYGPPGVGKSRYAREKYPGAYFKLTNKWWDGYQGEENVIIDDFELDHKVLGHHLKIWGDRYSFLAETKGGAIHIRPKRIIVTSNYSLAEIFTEDSMYEAVKRRYKCVHFVQYPIN